MAESEDELKSLLIKVKEETVKASLKLNIQKTKITASSAITSWQIDGKQWKQQETLILGLQNHCNGTLLQYPCLENPKDREAWWAAVHGVAKSGTRLRDFTLTFHFHALEKEMATHSSVLAWRIPGMAEPAMRLHRVRHD